MGYGECDSNCLNDGRQDYLFSRIFSGSGNGGSWQTEDWEYYYENESDVWEGKDQRYSIEFSSWDDFAGHVAKLLSIYSSNDPDLFMRDFALMFAGISYDLPWYEAAIEAATGPVHHFLPESNNGLPERYIDSLAPADHQSHHYAGILFLAFYSSGASGVTVNLARDIWSPNTRRVEVNPGDIRLGNVAASHAGRLIGYYWGSNIRNLPNLIDRLSP